jgi:hypothetical protein
MILFIDNNIFLFTKSTIDIVTDVVSSLYQNLKSMLPTRGNIMLGIMNTFGVIYCKLCVNRLHIKYNNIKHITYRHTLGNLYICSICGTHLSKGGLKKIIWV